jgi:hypothetical protein
MCEGWEQLSDCVPDGFDGSRGGFAQHVLELGEDLLDRVQVGGNISAERTAWRPVSGCALARLSSRAAPTLVSWPTAGAIRVQH